ncbi:MAG: TerC family protein [Dehalococcoidia bacterium]
MDTAQIVLLAVFGTVVAGMFILDVGILHRKAHVVQFREATLWVIAWVSLAMLFNLFVFLLMGAESGGEFLAAYVIELSLSVDNVFVFAVVFAYFAIPREYQHRVLFWGILGAIIMRGIMIVGGIALLEALHWMVFVFGAFLVFTAIKMATQKEGDVDPEKNLVVRLFRRFMPVHDGFEGQRFFVKRNGRTYATLLFLALLVIESTDLLFAIDSVPAVLAISTDLFIVYTSNLFAIAGLRSLYFVVAGSLGRFHFLKYGLAGVLLFVGFKMLASEWYHVPVPISLGVIVLVIGGSVVASLLIKNKSAEAAHP